MPLPLLALAAALPSYKPRIPNADRVRDCDGLPAPGVGHLRQAGGGARNPFGRDFAEAGHRWTEELCRMDSDSDGRSNGLELGDPECIWVEGEVPTFDVGITHPGMACSGNDLMMPPPPAPPPEDDCSASDDANTPPSPRHSETFPASPPSSPPPFVSPLPGCNNYSAPSVGSHNFTFSGHPVQDGTSYIQGYFRFPLPANIAITRFSIVNANPQVVHHMILYRCNYDMSTFFGIPAEGFAMTCTDVVVAWAVGGQDFCLPEGLAYVIEDDMPHYMLEIHYDNPRNIKGIVDTSGFTISGQLFDNTGLQRVNVALAGAFIGPSVVQIPPGRSSYHSIVTIPARRLRNAFGNKPRRLFAILEHMHSIGRKQWLSVIDEDEGNEEEVACNTAYDFDLQETKYLPVPITIKPNQELRLHCVFDSSERLGMTYGGDGTQDEMCIMVLFFEGEPIQGFYPLLTGFIENDVGAGDHVCTRFQNAQPVQTNQTQLALAQSYNGTSNQTLINRTSNCSLRNESRTKLPGAQDILGAPPPPPAISTTSFLQALENDGYDLESGKRLLTAHAVMMMLVWGFIAPVAVLVPRCWRGVWRRNWLRVHQVLQLTGFAIMFAAMASSFYAMDALKKRHFESTAASGHKLIGAFIFVGVILQFGAVCRPEAGPNRRRAIWAWSHRIGGFGILILSIYNSLTGIERLPIFTGGDTSIMYTLYFGGLGIAAAFSAFGYLLAAHRNRVDMKAVEPPPKSHSPPTSQA